MVSVCRGWSRRWQGRRWPLQVAGELHTAVWTEEGELVTLGCGLYGMLGHGGKENELVPRLVEARLVATALPTARRMRITPRITPRMGRTAPPRTSTGATG